MIGHNCVSTSRSIQRQETSFIEFKLPFPPWMAYSFGKKNKNTQMKTTLYLALIGCLSLTLLGCNSQERKDISAIRNAVAEMDKTAMPRKPDQSKSNTINTSKGALTISTCEGKKDQNGRIYTEGPSRATGFFLIPRMQWANDAKEAERMLIEDYEAGNCAASL
jgi:hypothetical protein